MAALAPRRFFRTILGQTFAKTRALVQITVCLLVILAGGTALADDSAKKLLALIDYISSDYKNAVQGGKILNQNEYQEQLEFSRRSLELLDELKKAQSGDKAQLEPDLKTLVKHIENKAEPKVVADTANAVEKKIMAAYGIVPHPRQLPSLTAGRQLFIENCAQCHGQTGKGDGPGRESMNPKEPPPANFTNPEFMAGLSPFKAFNAISFGVDKTAMASFAAFSDEQRWQLGFYIMSLRFSEAQAKRGEALLQRKPLPSELASVATLSTLSDEQLSEKLETYFTDESQAGDVLAYFRRGLLEKSADPLLIARARLREATELYAKGDKETAYQKAVEAYLDGFEFAEPALFAKDNSFGRNVESKFTDFRNAIKAGLPLEEIQKQQQALDHSLDEASQILNANSNYSGIYFFSNSALIILREGLEAALILAAILAMLKVMGAIEAIRYIHLGWVLALVAGGLTWVATQSVLTLSGQHRESMEGFISVFAAGALFYVGYWLHTRSEANKWREFIHQRVSNVVSNKKLLGLMGISFFAVYREAFEVILFYEALWLQNGSSHGAIVWGFATGLVGLILASFAILKLGLKIPLKYFFIATGTLLYIMAFIFAGNGIKELQAAGWVPSTPVTFAPQVPLLGIYPTLQTLAAQGLMLLAFMTTTIFLLRERNKAEQEWHRASNKKSSQKRA